MTAHSTEDTLLDSLGFKKMSHAMILSRLNLKGGDIFVDWRQTLKNLLDTDFTQCAGSR